MPSRKDDPDARLTIGYSIYRLPRSGLVQRPFTTHADRLRPCLDLLKDLEIAAVPPGFRSSFRDWACRL